MKNLFVGVDPGHDGALAILPEDGDEPVILYMWDKSTKRKAGVYRLRKWAPPMDKPVRVWGGNMLALAMVHLNIEVESLMMEAEGWPTVEGLFLPGKANKNFISLAEVTGMQVLAVESACLRPARRIKGAMWRRQMMRLPQYTTRKRAHMAEKQYGAIKWGAWVKGWPVPQHAWAALWLAEYSRMMWRHEQKMKEGR